MARTAEVEPLTGLPALYNHLTLGAIDAEDLAAVAPPPRGTWLIVAYGPTRRRRYVPGGRDGRHRWAAAAPFPFLPYPSEIREKGRTLQLPEGGCYIAIYSGSVETLSNPKVLSRAALLLEEMPEKWLDMVAYDRTDPDRPAALWSLRHGVGITSERPTASTTTPFQAPTEHDPPLVGRLPDARTGNPNWALPWRDAQRAHEEDAA